MHTTLKLSAFSFLLELFGKLNDLETIQVEKTGYKRTIYFHQPFHLFIQPPIFDVPQPYFYLYRQKTIYFYNQILNQTMQSLKTVFTVFFLKLLVLGEIINIGDRMEAIKRIKKQSERITLKLQKFVQYGTDRLSGSEPIINICYEQFLALYKPQKIRGSKSFKNYKQESQYMYRRQIFYQNVQLINKFNQDPRNSYKKGLNQFADISSKQFQTSNKVYINPENFVRVSGPLNKLPQEEAFKDAVNKYLIDLKQEAKNKNQFNQKNLIDIKIASSFREAPIINGRKVTTKQYIQYIKYQKSTPPKQHIKLNMYTTPENVTIDWRNQSGEVGFQGLCNACYAFAALDSIYTTQRIRNISNAQPLSVQEIISCIKQYSDESDGCVGGLPENVYLYIRDRGVGPERLNPIATPAVVGREEGKCDKALIDSPEYKKKKLTIYDYNPVTLGDCRKIVNLLKTTSLSVIITGRDLQFYKQGVYRNPYTWLTDPRQLDHAVSLVGYNGTDGSFMIRNSWGKLWGLSGFGFVDNRTGVCAVAYYPILRIP